MIGRLGAAALALGSAPLVARAIGPAGRGETGAAVALFGLIPVLIGFGLPQEARRLLAVDSSTAVMAAVHRFVLWSFLPSSVAGFIAAVTLFKDYESSARTVAVIGVALAPLILSWMVCVSVLVVRKDYVGIALLQLLQPTVYLVAVALLWSLNMATTATVIGAYLLGVLATFLLGLVRVGRSSGKKPLKLIVLVRGSSRFAGGALAETSTNRLDQVLALPILGAVGAGFFSVGVTVAMAPLAISQALAAAAFTDVARKSGIDRQQVVNRAIRQVSSLAFVVAIVLVIVGPWLVVQVFGSEFEPAGLVVQLSSIACYFASVSYQASNILVAVGKGVALTLCQVAALLAGVILLLWLGPMWGPAGAALASIISFALLACSTTKLSGAVWTSMIPTLDGLVTGVGTLFRRGSLQ